MEIEELIKKKDELAEKIVELIKSFESDNNVLINDINIWFSSYNRDSERINITIGIRL